MMPDTAFIYTGHRIKIDDARLTRLKKIEFGSTVRASTQVLYTRHHCACSSQPQPIADDRKKTFR